MNKTHTIPYGTETIEFSLTHTERKTLEINVHPDTTVSVVAPIDASIEKIKSKITKRAYWITQQKKYFQSILPYQTPKEYVPGETHHYIGRKYRLKIIESQEKPTVKLKGKYFEIHTKDKINTTKIQAQLEEWYRTQATKKFKERLNLAYAQIKQEGIPFPALELREMKTRWGSCTRTKILINPDLIKAPVYCIDYVIVHELCHLKIPNHSPAFYKLKEKYLPDWKERKKKLESKPST